MIFNLGIFKDISDAWDYGGVSSLQNEERINQGLIHMSSGQVRIIIKMYWYLLYKGAPVMQRPNLNTSKFSEMFQRQDVERIIKPIADSLGIKFSGVFTVFYAIYVGVSEGKDWIRFTNPDLAKLIKKAVDDKDPNPLDELFGDMKKQLIITLSVAAAGVTTYYVTKNKKQKRVR